MDIDFWKDKWDKNVIGFHLSEVNPLLVKYYEQLTLDTTARVFLPLCGKTKDISWLLSKGHSIVGVEFSELAVQQLFDELQVEPKITTLKDLKLYSAQGLDIFVGDFFKLTSELVGHVDAIYDRAALVALPNPIREQYSTYLKGLTHEAPQLLVTFKYDENLLQGPPFSVSNGEVYEHYEKQYKVVLLDNKDEKFKGKIDAQESVWLLKK